MIGIEPLCDRRHDSEVAGPAIAIIIILIAAIHLLLHGMAGMPETVGVGGFENMMQKCSSFGA